MTFRIVLDGWPESAASLAETPRTIDGARVAAAGLARALAANSEHGAQISVYVPPEARQATRQRIEEEGLAERVIVRGAGELAAIARSGEPAIIQLMGPALWRGIHLRAMFDAPKWPVTGLAHAMSPPVFMRHLVLTSALRPQSHDALVSYTTVAHDVLRRLIDAAPGGAGLANMQTPIIPSGIDLVTPQPRQDARRSLRFDQHATTWLYLGRIDMNYKADLRPLLLVLRRVEGDPPPTLIVAGAVALGETSLTPLRIRAAELGVSERVKWYPNVDAQTKHELLSAADLLVSPSDSLEESFGLTVLEAMAYGLPVVASDWNGYRELVVHNETGLLVPTLLTDDVTEVSLRAPLEASRDIHAQLAQRTVVDVDVLQAELTRLSNDERLRRALGAAGYERARREFSWSRVVRAYCELFQEQLSVVRYAPQNIQPPRLAYDYGAVFQDHPTERLRLDAHVEAVPDAFPATLIATSPPWLRSELLERMLADCKHTCRVADLPGELSVNLLHVSYLLKQGALRVAR